MTSKGSNYIEDMNAKIFAEEYMVQNRSKHIDTNSLLKNIVERNLWPADTALTKPLGSALFNRFRKMMRFVKVCLEGKQSSHGDKFTDNKHCMIRRECRIF